MKPSIQSLKGRCPKMKKMIKLFSISSLITLSIALLSGCSEKSGSEMINPNHFKGSDTQRIRAAVDAAKGTTNKVLIPAVNSNGTNIWMLDSAVLIPANMTVILDNCIIQMSDQSRDNMFRSSNVGIGITNPEWIENIRIIGVGDVVLKGANNPRSTGDGARTLTLNPDEEIAKGNWRVSYGSDAGKAGIKQKGDWRNIMILMAYVDGFIMKNINIENSHGWAVSFERTRNADISDIRINNPEEINVKGRKVKVSNKDGINLRHGCKNFRIDNISGSTGDDFIALSSLDTGSGANDNGNITSSMVTTRKWRGAEDDTEEIVISNISCLTKYRGVAIRASDSASIHNVYINGLITREWNGITNSILIGGKGYGKLSIPGKINHIYAMNFTGEGKSLILMEAPIADCYFTNGVYKGTGDEIVTYNIDKAETRNVVFQNLIKAP
jgi:polygalacturonase